MSKAQLLSIIVIAASLVGCKSQEQVAAEQEQVRTVPVQVDRRPKQAVPKGKPYRATQAEPGRLPTDEQQRRVHPSVRTFESKGFDFIYLNDSKPKPNLDGLKDTFMALVDADMANRPGFINEQRRILIYQPVEKTAEGWTANVSTAFYKLVPIDEARIWRVNYHYTATYTSKNNQGDWTKQSASVKITTPDNVVNARLVHGEQWVEQL